MVLDVFVSLWSVCRWRKGFYFINMCWYFNILHYLCKERVLVGVMTRYYRRYVDMHIVFGESRSSLNWSIPRA